MVEGQVIPTTSHHHQPPKAEAELLYQLNSGFREICVKCPIEYRTTKSTTQKLWQIIKFLSRRDDNSWPDEDGNHSNE